MPKSFIKMLVFMLLCLAFIHVFIAIEGRIIGRRPTN
jgi:hypothetical protein